MPSQKAVLYDLVGCATDDIGRKRGDECRVQPKDMDQEVEVAPVNDEAARGQLEVKIGTHLPPVPIKPDLTLGA